MVAYIKGPAYKAAFSFLGVNPSLFRSYLPNLILWGGATGAGIATFTEGWPLFQQTFYSKIPVFGSHWIENKDPEEIPI
ncbi:uncharacterized protein RJT21DRAFT_120470 [Scheffersomyces amazonensis]|uniref:uncharacterized protein n=1 Tax=Scheffersomyces amazonensis TaxID=1078765 RepID=UPI00315C7193